MKLHFKGPLKKKYIPLRLLSFKEHRTQLQHKALGLDKVTSLEDVSSSKK